METEILLQRCRRGDELAWEALVRRYQGRIFALAYHYLRDREEARDVAQETFVRIYRGLESFEASGSFTAWAVRVARNCALDRIRHLKARLAPTPLDDETEARVECGQAPDEPAQESERRDLIERALDRMTAINREMILLKEIQGLKQQEIADLLSIPLGTVKARTNRARLELARWVLDLDPSYGA